jgi:uncharacterized protein YyaL (SSP411 family)
MSGRSGSRALLLVLLALSGCRAGGTPADGAGALLGSFTPPGATPFDERTAEMLQERWSRRDAAYVPRTSHLQPDGAPKYLNRLFLESSPYLLQHAHNPVNWYPWGDEAFEAARRLGRPVLLSVGYSTCHWCHVMEEESFEDEEIARYLNENYIAIKVDREERPDIDAVYMAAVQAMTGRGGWPMTVWLTPDQKPFFGGTYFPARDGDRGAQKGFLTILASLRAAYADDRGQVESAAGNLSAMVRENLAGPIPGSDLPGRSALQAAFADYQRAYDPQFGGVGGGTKFPASLPIRFLLRYHRNTGDEQALGMASHTLEQMARGGLRDQVGGGFHRYSVDRQWLVPHFEKMLYDNALLAVAYLEAFQVTGCAEFRGVVDDIFGFVARDMTAPDGAFYAATDADSPGPDGRREEGLFFTWTPAEIADVVGAERARAVMAWYDVDAAGDLDGRSILHTPRTAGVVARELGLTVEALRRIIDESRGAMLEARHRRPPPLRDDKILAGWNGLMISALAKAALVLDEPRYAARATAAAGFILDRMWDGEALDRRYSADGEGPRALLDDYAFLAQGLIDLYEATGDTRWLSGAIDLDKALSRSFADPAGGYFLAGSDHEALLAREKPLVDGVLPSGNSVQALNLLRLLAFTTDDSYRQRAEATLRSAATIVQESPTRMPDMLLAVDWLLDDPREIVIVTPNGREEASSMLALLGATFMPNRALAVASEAEARGSHAQWVPLLKDKVALSGKATAYICERGVCALPTTEPGLFAGQLERAVPGSRR